MLAHHPFIFYVRQIFHYSGILLPPLFVERVLPMSALRSVVNKKDPSRKYPHRYLGGLSYDLINHDIQMTEAVHSSHN